MRIIPVPCRADNYMYILECEDTKQTAVVDPYDPAKLKAAAEKEGVKLANSLFTTHHHHDHSGGNEEFIKLVPGVKVYAGSEQAPGAEVLLKHGKKFKLGNLDVTALHTPCHTQDHICYFVEDKSRDQRGVFTGDTLFIAGCGRFFEGTAGEMNVALNDRLASLPDSTVVWNGHEYTKSNVAFAKSVDGNNPAVKKLDEFIKKNEVTCGTSTIGDEKEHNPFMRLNSAAIRESTKSNNPLEVMQALRELKNNFKG